MRWRRSPRSRPSVTLMRMTENGMDSDLRRGPRLVQVRPVREMTERGWLNIALVVIALFTVYSYEWRIERQNRRIVADQDMMMALLDESICEARVPAVPCKAERAKVNDSFAAWEKVK
jgi:hypothetical protein